MTRPRALVVVAAAAWASVAPDARAGDASAELAAAARASDRPTECGGANAAAWASRWERARNPGLARYCDLLAVGYAALRSAPASALSSAVAADRILPGHAAPSVLAARADVALRKNDEAWTRFQRASSLERRALESPGALHDYARAALRTGHLDDALRAYRALVPRAGLLDDATEATTVLVETAVLAMNRGRDGVAEAIGYLAEARRKPLPPGLSDFVLGALSLAENRAGRASESVATASEASGPWRLESLRTVVEGPARAGIPELPPGEIDALVATLAERRDRALALERWQSYLSGPGGQGPFAAEESARRDALRAGRSGLR